MILRAENLIKNIRPELLLTTFRCMLHREKLLGYSGQTVPVKPQRFT
jgi:hypothetical protein